VRRLTDVINRIGLCTTSDVTVFIVLTFLSSCFSGISQVMLPLVAELSKDESRAFNISIVATGPTFGILLARILSGIVTQYTSWRNVYWLALSLNFVVLLMLWAFMPNYPATNPIPLMKLIKTYPQILWSIITLYFRWPVLVQACFLSFCTFFVVTSYWTTLTFLLAGSPYHYNSIVIGLFGLVGLSTMVLGPVYSKYVIQPLKEPMYSVIIGTTVNLVGTAIGTYAGTRTVAGPILQAALLDAGLMINQISSRVAIHSVEPKGRNRVNTAFVTALYAGQLTGTKAGNDVYEMYGGWVAAGSLSMGVIAFSYLVIFARGPHEEGWIGWGGGWGVKAKGKECDEEQGQVDGKETVEMEDMEKHEKHEQDEKASVRDKRHGADMIEKYVNDEIKPEPRKFER
jgi:predicted MFS family arabinose efflux permease